MTTYARFTSASSIEDINNILRGMVKTTLYAGEIYSTHIVTTTNIYGDTVEYNLKDVTIDTYFEVISSDESPFATKYIDSETFIRFNDMLGMLDQRAKDIDDANMIDKMVNMIENSLDDDDTPTFDPHELDARMLEERRAFGCVTLEVPSLLVAEYLNY